MSMRMKAAFIIMLIVFVVTATGFITNFIFVRQSITNAVEQDMSLAIDIADNLVSTKIRLIKANGAIVAERLLKAISSKEMTKIMASEIAKFPEFKALSVFSRKHGIIANYGVPVKFMELLEENRYVQMTYSGESVIPTTHYDPDTNDFIMHVFVPMTSDMAMIATISGLTFSDIIRSYKLWQTGSIFMLDEEGTLIAGNTDELVLKRQNLIKETEANPDDMELLSRRDNLELVLATEKGTGFFINYGIEYICQYKRVSNTTANWHVVVAAPLREGPATKIRQDLLYSSLVFLAVGLLISIFVSPFVVKPYEKIAEQSYKILEAHKRTNLLLNAMPFACHIWNSDYEMFYCNDENQRLFKLESAEDFLNSYDDFIPEYQNDGQLSSEKKNNCLKKAFEEGRCKFEWMYRLNNGAKLPTEITLVRIPFDDTNVVAAYVWDMREQKKMTSEIEQRDKLLDTINKAAAILLKSELDEFENNLQLCLSMIANVMGIDRIYIWKNYIKESELYATQIYEWSGSVKPQQNTAYTVDVQYTKRLPGWEATLSSGKCINSLVGGMSAEEQAELVPQGIKSILVFPISLQDGFWGFIGYDDCHRERVFSENEQSILSSAGNIIAYAVFQNEMTKSIRTSAAKLEAVINNYSGIIWVVDRNMRITMFHGRYLDNLNYTSSSVVGLTLDQYLKDNVGKRMHKVYYENILKTFTEGHQEWITISRDKRLRFHSIPIYDDYGDVTEVVGNVDDITELSRLQTELEAALLETKEANNAKSDFLARMSHEMRTPLNAIIGLSELSIDAGDASESTHSNLEKIYEAGATLLSIVNDILDISKIEAGKFELLPNKYDFPSLINDAISLNILRIGEKPIKFVLDIDPGLPNYLYGDELRIKQIISNLLSNAFKYTREGEVKLSVNCEQDGAHSLYKEGETVWMIIRVEDSGRGIKAEDIKKLFIDYTQMDVGANRLIEGTGLGLAITKKIVEMMDGSIGVESEYGKGSVFTVKIKQECINGSIIGKEVVKNLEKFKYSDQKRRKKSRLVRKRMPHARVLVVDDVATNLDVTKGMLSIYGMQIDCVTSGQESIRVIRDEKVKYDAIFMDHMMPEMDGIEATKIIREEIGTEYAKSVPIIALTANAIVGNEEMFLQKGFQAFISKPIDVIQLDTILNIWVAERQSKETLLNAEKYSAMIKPTPQNNLNIFKDIFIEGLDFIQGIEMFNSESAYLRVIRSYYLETPSLLKKFKTFTAEGEGMSLREYATLIHGLKGASYGICANIVGKEAEELEKAAISDDVELIMARNASFIAMAESLLYDLGELLQKADKGRGVKETVSAPDRGLLSRLLKAANRYKVSTMERIIGELESYEYESGDDLVTWLRNQADDLEYDAIRERLGEFLYNDRLINSRRNKK